MLSRQTLLSLMSTALSQFSPNTWRKGWLALLNIIILVLTTIDVSLFTYICTLTSHVIQANFAVIFYASGVFCPICDDQITYMYCFVTFCCVVSSRHAVITRLIIIKVHAHWQYVTSSSCVWYHSKLAINAQKLILWKANPSFKRICSNGEDCKALAWLWLP